MNECANESPSWTQLRTYPGSAAAEVDAAYLRGEGIPSQVTGCGPFPGLPGEAVLFVPSADAERARWLLKLPPVSEAELDFLATGELPRKGEAE